MRIRIKNFSMAITMCLIFSLIFIMTHIAAYAEAVTGADLDVKIEGNWHSSGYNYYKLEAKLTNNTSNDFSDWEAIIDLPADSVITKIWDGSGNLENGRLTVTPAHWNNTVHTGSCTTFGFIFYTAGEYCRSTEMVSINGSITALNEVPEDAEETADCDVKLNIVSSWASDKTNYYQLELSVTNAASDTLDKWCADITIPDNTELISGWCADFKLKDNTLIITPMDYNSTILSGESIDNIGFIIGVKGSFDENVMVTINNKSYNVNTAAAQTETQPSAAAQTEYSSRLHTAKTRRYAAANVPESPGMTGADGTPAAEHGQLSVNGTSIVDENGIPFQLKGVSTHGLAWFPDYVNKDAFKTLRDYGANVIRLALYSDYGAGYDKSLHSLVDSGVKYASELGMYVIIDWHILGDGNPNTNKADAEAFFSEMSAKYADYNNVIYEICNEPNGVSWKDDIKPYAEDIIDIIRSNDDDAIIIVGTPTWSQDVDIVSEDPITGETNIMYALHYYAATHTDFLRQKAVTALNNGLPVFVSEFGTCDASGNGGNNFTESDKWIDLLNKYNISYVCWNLSNKNESSALISPSCSKTSGWSYDELSESGKWLFKLLGSD